MSHMNDFEELAQIDKELHEIKQQNLLESNNQYINC